MCVAYLQWYDTYKAANMLSGISLHISWQANSNLLCSLIYELAVRDYSEAWKCISPLLLFDEFESNRLYPIFFDTMTFGIRFSRHHKSAQVPNILFWKVL